MMTLIHKFLWMTATGFSEFEYVHTKFNLYMHNSTGGVRIKTVKL